MSLSQRDALDAWNKSTDKWLRNIAYNRTSESYRLLATYFLSAFWHGLYPGYYLTFLTGGLGTIASRSVRRYFRSRFVHSRKLLLFYHCVTWLTTRIMLAYFTVPFLMLGFWRSIRFFNSFYWFGHWLPLLAWILIPKILNSEYGKSPSKTDGCYKVR